MLVLTRKLGEKIVIGDSILIKVLKISNNKVRLGIMAPEEVPIFRHEVIEKITRFNRIANQTDHKQLKKVALLFKQLVN